MTSLVVTESRWLLYVILILGLGVILVRQSSEATDSRLGQIFLGIGVPALLPYALQSLLNRWLGEGHEGRNLALETLEIDAAVVVGLTAFVIIASLHRSRNSLTGPESLAFSAVVIATILSLFNSWIGDTVLRTTPQKYTFIFAVCLATLYLDSAIEKESESTRIPKSVERLIGSIFVSLNILLAIRVDGLRAEGSWFHVAYFSGVVESVKAGGTLLWDTPSQYGFLNLLVPSMIPFIGAQQSFLVFQATLLVLIPCAAFFALWNKSRSMVGISVGFCYLLLVHFMNPALMGPQAFPSSSVMRFGPSVVVLLLVARLRPPMSHKFSNLISLVICIAILWSFESCFYTVMILLGVIAGSRGKSLYVQQVNVVIRKVFVQSSLLISVLVAAYTTYVFLKVGGLPSWSWFWLAATKYAGGFGALPTDLSGSGFFVVVAIVITALGSLYVPPPVRPVFTASAFALTAWFSYYIGRSHSANILALLPSIFLAVSLPLIHSSWYFQSRNHDRLKVIRASHIGLCVTIMGFFVAALLTNPLVPSLIANYRPLPLSVQFEDGATFPEELKLLLGSLEQGSRAPIAYQGNFGVLPDIPVELESVIDKGKVWLPKPLALLEFPFPESVRDEVLKRRVERFSPSGYFVWHKALSVPEHGELWKRALKRHFECRVVTDSDSWEISECISLSR